MPDSTQKRVRQLYQRLADEYDQRWSHYLQASVRETLKRLPRSQGLSILDLGCGTGALLAALAAENRNYRLCGIDTTEAMLQIARNRLPDSVELHHAAAEAPPFPDRSFDVIVSTSVWHYLDRPEEALARARRILRPGGLVTITDWCADFATMRVMDAWLRVTHSAHHRTYSSRALAAQLTVSNYTLLELDTYRISPWWALMTATARLEPEKIPIERPAANH